MKIHISIRRFGAVVSAIGLIMLIANANFAQTGGTYEIEKSVIASGGNTSSGGTFSLESTSGQSVSNASPSSGIYQILSGFWTPAFAPTAASVAISGRVLFLNGSGMPRAFVSYTDGFGNIKTAQTSTFGYFRFENVEVGQTYIFQVSAKGYLFAPQVINVSESINRLNFSPLSKGQIETGTRQDGDNFPATKLK